MSFTSSYYHDLVSTAPDCKNCPLRYKKKVYPDGPIPAQIAFVGEAPGAKEEREGRPFIGPSGELMWEHFGPAVGIAREDVWVTNAILCRLEKVKLATGAILPKDTVMELAAACCHRRLIDELRVVNPNPSFVIVPLGNTALRALTGIAKAKIYAYRGSIQQVDIHGIF